MKVQVLKPFSQYKAGEIVGVEADRDGMPTEKFWRKRLHDAKRDNCIRVLSEADLKAIERDRKEADKEVRARIEANQKKNQPKKSPKEQSKEKDTQTPVKDEE